MTRWAAVHLAGGAALAALCLAALFRGDPPPDLAAIIAGDGPDRLILMEFRVPRVLLAIASGAALGLAGAAMQTALRNPLASPDVIGFTAGAAAGAAAAIVWGGVSWATPGALLGGGAAAALVLGLAWSDGLPRLALVLVGVAVSLVLITATDMILNLSPELQAAETARFLSGSFAAADWRSALLMTGLAVGGGLFLFRLSFAIDRLELGEDMARALGVDPDRTRLLVAGAAAALVSVSVSLTGPLPFVAFLAGPIARLASGRTGVVAPLACLVGALIAVGADLLAAPLIYGTRLPAGVFTALVGGPAMVFLLLRMKGARA